MKVIFYVIALFVIYSCKDQSPTNVFTPAAASNETSFDIQHPISNDTVLHHKNFKSSYVNNRNLDIWLPKGYPLTDVTYKVLYLHDGQHVFNDYKNTRTTSWELDVIMDSLTNNNSIAPSIVIAIANNPKKRLNEYMPQQPKELTQTAFARDELKKQTGFNSLYSDNYLKFITSEVIPFVRANFQVSDEPKDNVVMGNGYGGLISLFAISEYPRIFGNAGCFNTTWEVPILGEAYINSLEETIPISKNHRIYFNYSHINTNSTYVNFQNRVDQMFIIKGYTSQNYQSVTSVTTIINESYPTQDVIPALLYLLN